MATARKAVTQEDFWKGMDELRKSQQETGKQIKETDKRFKETSKQIRQLSVELDKVNGNFDNKWGNFVESLVEGDLVKLLQDRKIDVIGVAKEHKRTIDGKDYEIDIIAINGKEIVVTEVKTTLGKKDVDDFIKKLKVFKDYFKEYKNRKIYGCVAYLRENQGSAGYSQKQGLLVIRATGSSASIVNKKSFRPKNLRVENGSFLTGSFQFCKIFFKS